MQNKLVENWLTNANEISFTIPFVQLLISEGYRVIQTHGGVIEQGKDVIAYDKNGVLCCFQLKCGDIGNKEWHEIRGQINDLTEIPPINPSITEPVNKWECYLVTNGDIPAPTARTIADASNSKVNNGNMAIHTVTKEALLKRFQDKFGNFLPTEPESVQTFFKIYCENGDNTLDDGHFKQYFEKFFTNRGGLTKPRKLEAIHASTILCSYLIAYKYERENRTAIINAWLLLLFSVMHFVVSWNLPLSKINQTYQIILEEVETQFKLLLDDVAADTKYLVNGEYGIFSEPLSTYRIRCSQLLGYISGYLLYMQLAGRISEVSLPKGISEKIQLMTSHKIIVGEVMVPYAILTDLITIIKGVPMVAVVDLESLIRGIIANNDERDELGLINPYYSIEESVAYYLGINKDDSENFKNRSFSMWTIVLLLAKLGRKDFLNEKWPDISTITTQQFKPDNSIDLLKWRADDGDLIDIFPSSPQSWKELKKEVNISYDSELPSLLTSRKELLPLLLLVMPHRLSPATVLPMLNS